MKRWFMRLPIRQKLVTMILVTSGIVVTLTSVGHFINDYRITRSLAVEELSIQARLILDSAKSAIAFKDARVGSEALYSLQSVEEVRTACLYDEDRHILATYYRTDDSARCPEVPPPDYTSVEAGRITVVVTQVEDEKRLGAVYVRADLTAVEQQLRGQILILLAVLLIALGVATFLSAWLQALVSEPIRALAPLLALAG